MTFKKMFRSFMLRIISKQKTQKNKIPSYTQGDFDRQLNYNLWSTSRTRFTAAKRMEEKNKLSGRTIAFSSAYLILLSLIQLFIVNKELNQLVTYLNISIAIIIMIIGQMESSSNYTLKAHKFHECGLEINSLYKRLRKLKSKYTNKEKDDEFWTQVEDIDDKYDLILKRFENHDDIDSKLFRVSYPNYPDHNIGPAKILFIKLKHYVTTKMLYHLMIYIPPVALTVFAFNILGFSSLYLFLKSIIEYFV